MPTLIEDTNIEVDEVVYQEEHLQRIVISYTLTSGTGNEALVHNYEFYTDDYDYTGNSAWAEFIGLITRETGIDSIIYNAKRFESVMYEFANLCLDTKQCAATA